MDANVKQLQLQGDVKYGDNTDTSATSLAGPNVSAMMKFPSNVGTSKDPHFINESKVSAAPTASATSKDPHFFGSSMM
ncbi:hypothetical protein ACH5RR_023746 [Cinchona calisaya]|uniref:Uncharacterized protein n=1 Tax=Cinchona calisaya TaxID=153742 RepID=A0ABD2ZCM1_9GENT